MEAKQPYCFKVRPGSGVCPDPGGHSVEQVAARCYAGHFPATGAVYRAWDRLALIHCVDSHAWAGWAHSGYTHTR